MKTQSVHISDFFAREVRDYSIYACQRAIPSGIDGLKPSQRKVLFGMQKKFPNQEVKVSIASAGIMECLIGSTLVATVNGHKRIDELDPEDMIISYNVTTGELETDCQFLIEKGETTELMEIVDESGEKHYMTPTHRVLTVEGWKEARYLSDTDVIVSRYDVK